MKKPRRGRLLALALTGLLLVPELAYWAGTRATDGVGRGASCGVLVLGFPPNKDGSPSRMERQRVETGVETFRGARCSMLILSGGKPHSTRAEAEVMGELAVAAGVPGDALVLEGRSRNTWENVRYSLPDLVGFEAVYLVSDGLHVHRGRRYLCKQSPELCARVRTAARYRFGELYGLKWLGLAHEAFSAARDALRD